MAIGLTHGGSNIYASAKASTEVLVGTKGWRSHSSS